MYWSRTDSSLDILLYLLLSGCWGLGGWLLVRHAFSLPRGERLRKGSKFYTRVQDVIIPAV